MPAYLSRGPPVLQHPERVVPLSECKRFEPHFQPNVALAPIPAPSVPVVLPPSAHHQRRHRHEHKRYSHHLSSSNEKKEPPSDSVKLEKASPTCGSGVDAYSEFPSYTPGSNQKELPEKSKNEVAAEEEESSAAVTSSTVSIEPPSAEIGTSSLESDSDSEGAAAIDLEERLLALEVPQDVLELARRIISENAQLRRHRRSDAREISRLRNQLQIQQQQSSNDSDKKEEPANASAADSTEGSEETEAILPANNKESEPVALAVSNE